MKKPELSSAECETVQTEILVGPELTIDCNFQKSMNENEMNFQYLEPLEVDILNSSFNLKESVFSVGENNAEKPSNYEEKMAEENKSSEGLILKELPDHLKYAFLLPEKGKSVIISVELTELEEQKLLKTLRKYKEAIAWSIEDLKGINPSICMHQILLEENAKTSIEQ